MGVQTMKPGRSDAVRNNEDRGLSVKFKVTSRGYPETEVALNRLTEMASVTEARAIWGRRPGKAPLVNAVVLWFVRLPPEQQVAALKGVMVGAPFDGPVTDDFKISAAGRPETLAALNRLTELGSTSEIRRIWGRRPGKAPILNAVIQWFAAQPKDVLARRIVDAMRVLDEVIADDDGTLGDLVRAGGPRPRPAPNRSSPEVKAIEVGESASAVARGEARPVRVRPSRPGGKSSAKKA